MNKTSTIKLMCVLLISLIFRTTSSAQLVYIPDADFRAYIATLDASAIVGDSLDTGNATVQNLSSMTLSGLPIQNLSGIEYFISLNYLRVQLPTLSIILSFPNALDTIWISGGTFSSLPALPSGLLWFGADNNNSFNVLPSLPNGLKHLGFPSTSVANLPFSLPSALEQLEMDNTPVTNLSNLPSGLQLLRASSCSVLTNLPPLPNGILLLDIHSSPNITCLGILPNSLQQLSVAFSGVTCLPNIPNNGNFNCDIGNTLCSFPGSLNTTHLTCNGICDGIIASAMIGGPYSYQWSNGNSSSGINNLCAGNYTLYVVDLNGCAFSSTATVNQPLPLTASAITQDVTCFGNADGQLIDNSNGGTPPLQFSLGGPFQSNPVFTNLAAGVYAYQVKDANGCISTTLVTINQPQQLSINVPLNVGICSGSSVQVCPTVIGGVPPYTYAWSGGQFPTQLCNTLTQVTLYTVLVTDVNGCTALLQFTPASYNSPFYANPQADTIVCSGSSLSICPFITGGTSPFLLSLELNAVPDPTFTFCSSFQPVQGIYQTTITDANGCTVQDDFIVNVAPAPQFTGILPGNVLVCNGTQVNVCAPNVTGGSGGPYSYLWSNGAITQCVSLGVGNYTYTAYDAFGCSVSNGFSITYSPGWNSLELTNITLPSCGMCNGQATVVLNGATQIATYNWFPGNITTAFNNSICDNTPSYVEIVDTSGCVDTLFFSLSCKPVWPGDANYDGVANNVDLLPIGIGYGTSGPVRPNATINWTPEIGVDWNDTLTSGLNYKHIDCNGDGIIADDDTVAIIQNYGLSHPLRMATVQNSVSNPPFYFEYVLDTVFTSQQLAIPLYLGSAAIPMDSLYGIAFTVNYDTSLVKADSIDLSFATSWLGAYGSEIISITKNDPVNGKLYAAVTRITHSHISGFGVLGVMTVVTTDNVSGRLLNPVFDTLVFSISDVMAIDELENLRLVNPMEHTIIIEDPTGIHEPDFNKMILCYPNPAAFVLNILVPFDIKLKQLELIDASGRKIDVNFIKTHMGYKLMTSELQNGIYQLHLSTDKGNVVRKLSIINNR